MWTHRLFAGIPEKDVSSLLLQMEAYTRSFRKGEYIVLQGTPVHTLGLLLSGRAFMEKEDFLGKIYLYSEVSREDPWGVSLLYPAPGGSEFSCRAITPCTFLFIPYPRFTVSTKEGSAWGAVLLQNFVKVAMLQNHILLEKLNLLSRRSLRERIYLYFYKLAKTQSGEGVASPLNRTELAEFLCVNRSALSRELFRMQEEGILRIQRNVYFIRFPWAP